MSRGLGPFTMLLCVLAASGCAGGRYTPGQDALPGQDFEQQDTGRALSFPDLGAPAVDGALPCANDEALVLGRCYLLLERPEGWTYQQARGACKDRKTHVVTIGTAQENTAVLALLGQPLGAVTHTSAGVWIGLRRSAPGNLAFVWESGQSPTYINWAPGEPSNHNENEDCVVLWRPSLPQAGSWNDTPCDSPKRGAVVCARMP